MLSLGTKNLKEEGGGGVYRLCEAMDGKVVRRGHHGVVYEGEIIALCRERGCDWVFYIYIYVCVCIERESQD